MTELDRTLKKKFSRSDGPFVKNLDQTLSSFHVQRQAYYGGTFVGNHVHSCLKVRSCEYGASVSAIACPLHRQTTSTCCVTVCLLWPARIVLPSSPNPSKLLIGTEKAYFFLVPATTSTSKTMWMQTKQKSCVSFDNSM